MEDQEEDQQEDSRRTETSNLGSGWSSSLDQSPRFLFVSPGAGTTQDASLCLMNGGSLVLPSAPWSLRSHHCVL